MRVAWMSRCSSSANTMGAPTAVALAWKTGRVSGVVSPITTGVPSLMMPAFLRQFFPGYYLKLHMVETDVGNDTQVGLNDVGTVQSSSKTDLYNGYIHLLFSEIGECMAVVSSKKEGWSGSKNARCFSTKSMTNS